MWLYIRKHIEHIIQKRKEKFNNHIENVITIIYLLKVGSEIYYNNSMPNE